MRRGWVIAGCLVASLAQGQSAALRASSARHAGDSPESTQTRRASHRRSSAAETRSDSGITRAQADAILSELRAIRRLLETDPLPSSGTSALNPTTTLCGAPARPPQIAKLSVSPGWYVLGREDAPVTLVEFTDYQCPYCRRFDLDTFGELKRQYIDTGKLQFVSRDMPLSFHPNAIAAAQAARCAGEQGKFWEMREALFAHANKLDLDSIAGYAAAAGLDAPALSDCVQSGRHRAAIEKDAADAAAAAISGTPAFVFARTSTKELEGQVIVGAQPFATFVAAMEKLMPSNTPAAASAGSGRGREK